MRVSCLLLALAVSAAAQQNPPPFIETYEVRVSNIDVVVSDRDGKPVHGLPRDVFEVRENGVVQPITNFAEYDVSASTATVQEQQKPAAAAPKAEAPPPRHFAFLIDELALHPGVRNKLRDATLAVVDSMRPNDLASVLLSTQPDKVALAFTSDKEAIRKSLRDAFDQGGFRMNTHLERERFFYEHQVMGQPDVRSRRDQARLYAALVSERVKSTLSAVRALIASLSPQPGRKVLVLVTESLSSQPGREAFTVEEQLQARADIPPNPLGLSSAGDDPIPIDDAMHKPMWFDARPMIAEIGALATAANVSIYSLQPQTGAHIGVGGTADQGGSRAGASSTTAVTSFQHEAVDETQNTLITLADASGGKAFLGDRNLDGAFRQIASDAGSYYSIGYRPTAQPASAARTLDVRVRSHPEYNVRFGRTTVRESPVRQMNDLVAASLMYPTAIDELGISVSSSKPLRNGRRFKVDVAVAVPLASLTFVPFEDKQRAIFTVHYAATGEDVAFHTGFDREQGIEVRNAEFAEAKTHAFTYTTSLVVNRGATTIAVAVQDPVSRKTSFKRITVDAR